MSIYSKKIFCLALFFLFYVDAALCVDNDSCIVVSTPTDDEIKDKGYKSWPIWSGKAITYPTKTYTSTELCYFIEGEVKVVTDTGKEYEIKAGDLVIFKKGCTCTWHVSKAVRKHYKFE